MSEAVEPRIALRKGQPIEAVLTKLAGFSWKNINEIYRSKKIERDITGDERRQVENIVQYIKNAGVGGILLSFIRAAAFYGLSLLDVSPNSDDIERITLAALKPVLPKDYDFYLECYRSQKLQEAQARGEIVQDVSNQVKQVNFFKELTAEELKSRSEKCIEAIVEAISRTVTPQTKGMMRLGPSEMKQVNTAYKPEAKFSSPILKTELDEAYHRLDAFCSKHQMEMEDGLFHFMATDLAPLDPKMDVRKAYIAPPISHATEFLEAFLILAKKNNIKWVDAKINLKDSITIDESGNAWGQWQNGVCFYFRNDEEFYRFLKTVHQAEQQSRIPLLSYQGDAGALYGQALDGKVNFGVDLPGGGSGTNFDEWKTDLITEGIKVKKAGGTREDIKRAIDIKLRKTRGVGIENFLSLHRKE